MSSLNNAKTLDMKMELRKLIKNYSKTEADDQLTTE
jgi:hypothetical protein